MRTTRKASTSRTLKAWTGSDATKGRVEVQSRSYSLVAHLDELPYLKNFAEKLPVKISLAYSVSSNFQPDSARVDINEGIPSLLRQARPPSVAF